MNKAKRTTTKFKPAISIAYAIVALVVAGIAIAGLTPVLTRKLPNLSTSSTIKNPKGWYEAYNAPKNGNGDPSDNHNYKPADLEPWQRYCKSSTKCDQPVKCSTLPGGKCKFTPPKGVTKFELFAVGAGGAGGSAVAQNPTTVSSDYAKTVLGKDQRTVSGNTIGAKPSSAAISPTGSGYEPVVGTFIDDNEGTSTSGLPARSNVIDVAASKIDTYPTTSTDDTSYKISGSLGQQTTEQTNVQYLNPFLDIFKANKFKDNKYYYYYTKTLGATKVGQPSVITLMPEWVKLVNQDKYMARYFCIDKLDPDCKNNPNFYSGSTYKKIGTNQVLKDTTDRKNVKAWATGCSTGGTNGDTVNRTVEKDTTKTIDTIKYGCTARSTTPYKVENAVVAVSELGFDWKKVAAAQKTCRDKQKTNFITNINEQLSDLDCNIKMQSWGNDVYIRCGSGKTERSRTVVSYVENTATPNGWNLTRSCENADNLYLVKDYNQTVKGGIAGDGACATIAVNVACVDGKGLCTRTNIYPTKFSAYDKLSIYHKKGKTIKTGKDKKECKLKREDYLHYDTNGRQTFWSPSSCNGAGGRGCGYIKKGGQYVCNDTKGQYCNLCVRMDTTDLTDHGCDGIGGSIGSFQLGCNENSNGMTCGSCTISGGGAGYSGHLLFNGGCETCGQPYTGKNGKNGEQAFVGSFDHHSYDIENTIPGTFNHLYTWYMPYVVKHLMFGTAGKMGEEVHTTITLSEGEELTVIPGNKAIKTDYKTGKDGAVGGSTVVKGNGSKNKYSIYAKGGTGGVGSQKTDRYLLCHISDLQTIDENLPCYYNSTKFDAKDTQTVEATYPSENSFTNKVKMSSTLSASNPGGGAFGYGTKSYSDFICQERYLISNDYWKTGNLKFFLENDGYKVSESSKCAGNTRIKYILPNDKKYSSGTGAVVIMW